MSDCEEGNRSRGKDLSEDAVVRGLPHSLPLFGDTLTVLKNVHRFHNWLVDMAEMAEGKPFAWKVIGQPPVVVLTTPELIKDVLKTQAECFEKGQAMREVMNEVLGTGIFTIDGLDWVHQRKTSSKLFTTRMLRETMNSTVHLLLLDVHRILHKAAVEHQFMDLATLFSRFKMEAFTEIGFRVQFKALDKPEEHEFQSAFDGAGEVLALRFILPMWFWKLQRWLNVGAEHKLKQHIRVIDNLVLGIISKAIEQRQLHRNVHKKDIVSLFLDQHLPDGSKQHEFDPLLLRDIVLNFLAAGRDTTSAALTWFFYAMAQNPQAEGKILRDIAHNLPELANSELSASSFRIYRIWKLQ